MTTTRPRSSLLSSVLILLPAILSGALACGARTSLLLPEGEGGAGAGGSGEGASDATPTSSSLSTSTGNDGGGGNVGGGGEGGGGGPPVEECAPDTLFIYLVTSETDLYRFDPSAADAGLPAFELVGNLSCPTQREGGPFSMAVSRSGRAYALYNSGELFRVNVETANCTATDWTPTGDDFQLFGMGYALDDDGRGETLYVADTPQDGFLSDGLARLDPSTLELDPIGGFDINPGTAIEMTSADDGQLYGYFLNDPPPGGTLVRIDKATAQILETVPLPPPTVGGTSLAFAYWNGDFFIFTGSGNSSDVTRYRPSDGSVEVVATLQRIIVGAGVSTCDPDGAR